MNIAGAKVMLLFIREHIQAQGYAPTLREIAVGLHIRSTNGVRYWLNRCIELGWIERTPVISRGITLTPEGKEVEPNG